MTQLLVSVRSAAEAEIALEGGAALIDVKEPSNGALGMATLQTISEVVHTVSGRVPVSAALGELRDGFPDTLPSGVAYYKWGLSGLRASDWQAAIHQGVRHLSRCAPDSRLVLVAYADHEIAEAPPVTAVFEYARHRPGNVLLIDTYSKTMLRDANGRRATLLTSCSVGGVEFMCWAAQAAGVQVALAGSLGAEEIVQLLRAAPDWFAVRGAVCEEGQRWGRVSLEKVRAFSELVQSNRA